MAVTDKDSSKQNIIGGFSSHGFLQDDVDNTGDSKEENLHGGD